MATQVEVYFGTYTENIESAEGGVSKGIYRILFDTKSGQVVSPLLLVAEDQDPSFLALDSTNRFIFSSNEVKSGDGSVTAFEIQGDGHLKKLGSQTTKGPWPCHVSVDAKGKNVLLANYGGSICVLPFDSKTGTLSSVSCHIKHEGFTHVTPRQEAPHPHSVTLSPSNNFAIVLDLGQDKLTSYRFDTEKGFLTPSSTVSTAPGAGPRHLDFHPNKKWAYTLNELSSTICFYEFNDNDGTLVEQQLHPTLPEDYKEESIAADIHVHPSGKFVYTSNRGHDSITVFHINSTGHLTFHSRVQTGGGHPRNFSLDPTGQWLLVANKDSNNIVFFHVDQQTGALSRTAELAVPKPTCVRFRPNSSA